jgi:hypothetical protein
LFHPLLVQHLSQLVAGIATPVERRAQVARPIEQIRQK